jgi:hypothetical protein
MSYIIFLPDTKRAEQVAPVCIDSDIDAVAFRGRMVARGALRRGKGPGYIQTVYTAGHRMSIYKEATISPSISLAKYKG